MSETAAVVVGVCRGCRRPISAGEAVRVTDTATGAHWLVCRPGVSWRCFATGVTAGADRQRVELEDPAAADRLDADAEAEYQRRARGDGGRTMPPEGGYRTRPQERTMPDPRPVPYTYNGRS